MLTNTELLHELLSIQGRVEYDTVLEELIDTVEKAVADEEAAAEPMPNPFDLPPFVAVYAVEIDEAGNRYRPDGSLIFHPEAPGTNLPDENDSNRWDAVPVNCSMRYRNTL